MAKRDRERRRLEKRQEKQAKKDAKRQAKEAAEARGIDAKRAPAAERKRPRRSAQR